MYPLIVIAKETETIQSFLQEYKTKHNFSPAFTLELHPLKTEIVIDQIRSLKKDLVTIPSEKRLVILYSFDKANIEAQNALLKTLEEKNDSNQFVLIVSDSERVLPTIRSRSHVHSLEKTTTQEIRESTTNLLDNILNNENHSFLADPAIQSVTREEAILLLQEVILFLHSQLHKGKNVGALLKKIMNMLQLLENNNLNPQLAIDTAFLHIKKGFNT